MVILLKTLEAKKAELLKQRVNTCGHTKRAWIQKQIDEIEDTIKEIEGNVAVK